MHQRGGRVGRIIPACAGSTRSIRRSTGRRRDHPRMRGEHLLSRSCTRFSRGSSPHARGALPRTGLVHDVAGIIPACAGSTARCRRSRCSRRDHPRMRGEHLGGHGVSFLLLGIIPACAGSTSWSRTETASAGDHPRMRGEHLVRAALPLRNRGIIPACAGSTCSCPCSSPCPWDHPRMRGEHSMTAFAQSVAEGSSPHARGALVQDHGINRPAGIIPACAGSTCPTRCSPTPSWDHPRMRGEHRAPSRWAVCIRRIIPACAGSTLEYLRLCPGLKRITLTLPITSEAGKWTEKHPNDQLMPRAFRPSR